MANKFQKSVLDRLEQEAALQKQKAKEVKKTQVPQQEPIKEENNSPPELAVPGTPELPLPVAEATPTKLRTEIPDISEYIRREQPRLAKNKTFYLDADVIETIKATAREQHITDSKLVNDILRRVLGL